MVLVFQRLEALFSVPSLIAGERMLKARGRPQGWPLGSFR